MTEQVDVAVVGAGPVGLACAIECQRQNQSVTVIDAGSLTETLRHYPTHMVFFSTSQQLEIGGHPFHTVNAKPTKYEAISYYRGVALAENLPLRLYERVESIGGELNNFSLKTSRGSIRAKRVIIATGFFHRPEPLDVQGAEQAKVSHYFTDGHRYAAQDLAIIGAANSAVIAALECWRMGARVTVIHRGSDFYTGVKYWLLPDIQNRIAEGSITAHFNTVVTMIDDQQLTLRRGEEEWTIANDWVLAMTGYRADFSWQQQQGILLNERNQPQVDQYHQIPTRPGLYVAGCAQCGDDTGSIFIENGRFHAVDIAEHIAATAS